MFEFTQTIIDLHTHTHTIWNFYCDYNESMDQFLTFLERLRIHLCSLVRSFLSLVFSMIFVRIKSQKDFINENK